MRESIDDEIGGVTKLTSDLLLNAFARLSSGLSQELFDEISSPGLEGFSS
jgi:hypothetical protein